MVARASLMTSGMPMARNPLPQTATGGSVASASSIERTRAACPTSCCGLARFQRTTRVRAGAPLTPKRRTQVACARSTSSLSLLRERRLVERAAEEPAQYRVAGRRTAGPLAAQPAGREQGIAAGFRRRHVAAAAHRPGNLRVGVDGEDAGAGHVPDGGGLIGGLGRQRREASRPRRARAPPAAGRRPPGSRPERCARARCAPPDRSRSAAVPRRTVPAGSAAVRASTSVAIPRGKLRNAPPSVARCACRRRASSTLRPWRSTALNCGRTASADRRSRSPAWMPPSRGCAIRSAASAPNRRRKKAPALSSSSDRRRGTSGSSATRSLPSGDRIVDRRNGPGRVAMPKAPPSGSGCKRVATENRRASRRLHGDQLCIDAQFTAERDAAGLGHQERVGAGVQDERPGDLGADDAARVRLGFEDQAGDALTMAFPRGGEPGDAAAENQDAGERLAHRLREAVD